MNVQLVRFFENDNETFQSYFTITVKKDRVFLTNDNLELSYKGNQITSISKIENNVKIFFGSFKFCLILFSTKEECTRHWNELKQNLNVGYTSDQIISALKNSVLDEIIQILENIDEVYEILEIKTDKPKDTYFDRLSGLFTEISFYLLDCNEIIALLLLIHSLCNDNMFYLIVKMTINHLKIKKHKLGSENIARILDLCNNTNWRKVLLIVAHNYYMPTVTYILNDFETFFNRINTHFDVYSLYILQTVLTSESPELLNAFYDNVHRIYLIDDKPYFNVTQIQELSYYKLELLCFMAGNHDYYFSDFILNTSICRHLRKYDYAGNVFFWDRFVKENASYENRLVSEHLEELNTRDLE